MKAIPIDGFIINWRRELAVLRPYLYERGGVVYVTGPQYSAYTTFTKLIQSEIRGTPPSVCVQMSPRDGTMRTPAGILANLEEVLGVSLPSPWTVMVGQNIQAGGDVTIEDIDINCSLNSFQVSVEMSRRTRTLIARIGALVQERKIILLLQDWNETPSSTANWFWRSLWSAGLDHLVNAGLTLIVVYDEDVYVHNELSASPATIITLPNAYDETSRGHALEDVANVLVNTTGEDLLLARARADSLLIAWEYRPALVYTGLVAHCAYLRGRA